VRKRPARKKVTRGELGVVPVAGKSGPSGRKKSPKEKTVTLVKKRHGALKEKTLLYPYERHLLKAEGGG